MARDLPKWHTQVTDVFPSPVTHAPRPHDTEKLARAYMADMFKRRKCSVVLLNPMGQQVDSMNYNPDEERREAAALHGDWQERLKPQPSGPYINTGLVNPNPDHEELAHEETAAQ